MPARSSITPLIFAVLLMLLPSTASLAEKDVDGLEELLPRRETVWEKLRWLGRKHLMPNRDLKADPPPSPPLRTRGDRRPGFD